MAHKQGTGSKFAKRYNINRLVYFEETDEAYAAISREKQIKGWKRRKKLELIESINPEWKDLSYDWFEPGMFVVFNGEYLLYQNNFPCMFCFEDVR